MRRMSQFTIPIKLYQSVELGHRLRLDRVHDIDVWPHFDEVEFSFLFGGPIQSLETESANLRFARPVS